MQRGRCGWSHLAGLTVMFHSVKGCHWVSEVGVQLAALSQWGGVRNECGGWLQLHMVYGVDVRVVAELSYIG